MSSNKRVWIRTADLLIDGVLARIRPLLWVFHVADRGYRGARWIFLLLANEHLKGRLGHCGQGVRLNGRMAFHAPGSIALGDNVHINDNAFLRGEGGIEIGSNCHISRNLVVYSTNHNYEGRALPYDDTHRERPVRIGDNVWIGMNVTIAPGVSIGEGAIIGMGTTIRRDIDPGAIVVSAPHEILKYRNAEHYERLCREGRFSGAAGVPRF